MQLISPAAAAEAATCETFVLKIEDSVAEGTKCPRDSASKVVVVSRLLLVAKTTSFSPASLHFFSVCFSFEPLPRQRYQWRPEEVLCGRLQLAQQQRQRRACNCSMASLLRDELFLQRSSDRQERLESDIVGCSEGVKLTSLYVWISATCRTCMRWL